MVVSKMQFKARASNIRVVLRLYLLSEYLANTLPLRNTENLTLLEFFLLRHFKRLKFQQYYNNIINIVQTKNYNISRKKGVEFRIVPLNKNIFANLPLNGIIPFKSSPSLFNENAVIIV